MAEPVTFNLFMNPFITNIILPFLLIFVVIYAILEKTGLLGKDKRYANLIIALVIGFLFIGVQGIVGFTLKLIPLVAMLIMILLCFYLIFGFIGTAHITGFKIALGIIFGLALIIVILWASGLLQTFAATEIRAEAIGIFALLAVLGGAIAIVLTQSGPSDASSSS